MPYSIHADRTRYASANTDKEGGGTEYRLVCDANGYLQVEIVGGAGSYPYNPETDDDSIPAGEVRETPNVLLHGYDYDGGSWERVLTDGSGRLQTTAVVISPGAYNPETDDCSVPYGESHESNIVLLYGLSTTPDPDIWQCLHTDDNNRLLVNSRIQDGDGVGLADVAQLTTYFTPNLDELYALVTVSLIHGRESDTVTREVRGNLANSDSDPNLDGKFGILVHSLLSARKDANTTIGITALDGVADGQASAGLNALVVASNLYAVDTGNNMDRLVGMPAVSETNPDMDGYNCLFTHALLSARVDANTTMGLACNASGALMVYTP